MGHFTGHDVNIAVSSEPGGHQGGANHNLVGPERADYVVDDAICPLN